MNKHLFRHIATLLLAATLLAACTDAQLVRQHNGSTSTLRFGFNHFASINVQTRVGLPPIAENRVMNLYLMVFDNEGKISYRHYFDHHELKESEVELDPTPQGEEAWWVLNRDPEVGPTHGAIKFRCKPMTGARLVLVANCATDILNITPEMLNHIQSLDDLQALKAQFTTRSLMRSGTLQMTAMANVDIAANGTLTLSGNDYGDLDRHPEPVLCLHRCDAKVTVRVGVVPGARTTHHFAHGDGTSSEAHQIIDSFEPESWQVMNLPCDAYLMPRTGVSIPSDERTFAHSTTYEFENKSQVEVQGYNWGNSETYDGDLPALTEMLREEHSFTFYTLETENTAKASLYTAEARATYGSALDGPAWQARQVALREKQPKHESDGSYTHPLSVEAVHQQPAADIWEFAPATAPFLVIKGVVHMKHKENGETAPQTLSANVTYYVHLGDFGDETDGVDNYSLLRNTSYTYTLNIHGVDNIQLEVERDNNGPWSPLNEEQSGAMGRVYVAQEEIVTFDAHYGQRAYCFNADKILRMGDVDNLTWSVYTPFGRGGMPERVGVDRVEVPTGLDYKWVYFMKHKRRGEGDPTSYTELPAAAPAQQLTVDVPEPDWPVHTYCHRQRWYPGDEYRQVQHRSSPHALMNVMDLCAWLRQETKKYKKLKDRLAANEISAEEFEGLVLTQTAFDSKHEIWVTAFVDEYYYTTDPISLIARPSLWHDFANQPNRAMHIMCDAHDSRDGDSRQVGTCVTLYQRSIQTIYNTTHATEGWGCETVDETPEKARKFYDLSEVQKHGNWTPIFDVSGTTDQDNGRYNMNAMLDGPWTWAEYMRFHIENKSTDMGDYGEMLPSKAAMRYSWLRRNRDNNGNGIIDEDEIRWYIAAINQLKELFIGDQGITASARLYDLGDQNDELKGSKANGYWKWRSHVVSSTTQGNQPVYLWAEEGVSTNTYGKEWEKPGRLSIRCVRNLERETNTRRDITKANDHPYSIIEMSGPDANGYYTFDLSRMNDKSKNMNIYGEPLPMDEYSPMSRAVNRFQTGPEQTTGPAASPGYSIVNTATMNYSHFKAELELGKTLSPEGYRTPTLREMLVIHSRLGNTNFFGTDTKNGYGCANYYSFGHSSVGGNGYDCNEGDSKSPQSWVFVKGYVLMDPDAKAKIRTVRTLE